MKNKGRKSACLQMVLCGIIICNALFLSGCQSTPDSEIVTNKNESVLVAIEKEEQTRQEEYEKTKPMQIDITSFDNSGTTGGNL